MLIWSFTVNNSCSVQDTNLAREVVAGPNPDAFSKRARAASEKLVRSVAGLSAETPRAYTSGFLLVQGGDVVMVTTVVAWWWWWW